MGLPAAEKVRSTSISERTLNRPFPKALAQLPPHVRLPLVLADIAELSTSEVARILALKEATVKTRVHRARLILRRGLLERLPVRPAPPPDHDRQMCLDLLQAKQDAMDRRVPFPFRPKSCAYVCRSVFATLDLGRATYMNLGRGQLPPALRELIERHRELGRHPRPVGLVASVANSQPIGKVRGATASAVGNQPAPLRIAVLIAKFLICIALRPFWLSALTGARTWNGNWNHSLWFRW